MKGLASAAQQLLGARPAGAGLAAAAQRLLNVQTPRPASTLALAGMAFEPTASAGAVDPTSYDHVLVMFSGGKDSLALLLLLVEMGIPLDRIQLWHHDIDGREGSSRAPEHVSECRKSMLTRSSTRSAPSMVSTANSAGDLRRSSSSGEIFSRPCRSRRARCFSSVLRKA